MEWTKVIEAVLGIGVGGGLVVVIAAYVVKSALATAVRLAGEKEIEQRKHELQKELERLKHDLATQGERERATASRDLERYKAELTLDAEVRRQVAALKVKLLLDFLRDAQSFMRGAFDIRPGDNAARAALVQKLHECFALGREVEPLVDRETHRRLSNFIAHTFAAGDRWVRAVEPDPLAPVMDELREIIDLVRRDLGVVARASETERTPPSGGTPDQGARG